MSSRLIFLFKKECELMVGESAKARTPEENKSNIESINDNLNEVINFKFDVEKTNENSPFYNVYSLLDGIGKKLDWPPINSLANNLSLRIEDKISLLFSLKAKLTQNDPVISKLNISLSSLNKQISFYGIAFFFHKLTEFFSLSKATFPQGLVLVSESFVVDRNESIRDVPSDAFALNERDGVHSAIASLVVCLKLWEKFNQHKEISTIITKCLSNSKLDTISIYKNFINDYYNNSFLLALNPKTVSNNLSWTSLSGFSCKQKIPIVAFLFMNEKKSFEPFFKALEQILSETPLAEDEKFDYLMLSNMSFNAFEFTKQNVLSYFSGLMLEKLKQVRIVIYLILTLSLI
jgi:hypothetical protein